MSLFRFTFDAMHAVTGAYAKPIFVDKLGGKLVFLHAYIENDIDITVLEVLIMNVRHVIQDSISNGVPQEDFGHGHPDPNLT